MPIDGSIIYFTHKEVMLKENARYLYVKYFHIYELVTNQYYTRYNQLVTIVQRGLFEQDNPQAILQFTKIK